MIKILFLIHDLRGGGAEKVLVNLVNNMDKTKFDITVMTLFDEGVNRQFLLPHVKYKSCFRHAIPGNSKLMLLLSPKQLHKWFIKEKYNIEVAYLEGPAARVISGCPDKTKTVSWIHISLETPEVFSTSFRSYLEARKCYSCFKEIVAVSEAVKQYFRYSSGLEKEVKVLYNTNESHKISCFGNESIQEGHFSEGLVNIIGVGKLVNTKGFDRLIRIGARLINEGFKIHIYILGEGSERERLDKITLEDGINEHVTFLGYQTNPYKYLSKANLFVCASHAEGFSTAVTEALVLGIPVCTVEVAGMKEMLGENNEYGIVTENSEEALYQGIKSLLGSPELLAHYKKQAEIRGKEFSTEKTVKAVENMLIELMKEDNS